MASLAKAILIPHPQSHPFQERTLILENKEPLKIGRCHSLSKDDEKPSPSNATFDCKVVSRNHATLWYEEGRFSIQDNKSSNGTFVNERKLVGGCTAEVFSGDVIQLGVDVTEGLSKRRGKTHGCVIAVLELSVSVPMGNCRNDDKDADFPIQEVHHLNNLMKEAIKKELDIDSKLAAVSQLLIATQEAVTSCWKAMDMEVQSARKIPQTLEGSVSNVNEEASKETLTRNKEQRSESEDLMYWTMQL